MNLQQKIDQILQFEGPIVANVVPFNSDGCINYSMITPYASYLNMIGVKGIYAHGTTGEGLSLASEEKKKLSETWWKEIQSKYSDWLGIFNVSATCMMETIDQANFYDQLGVNAIAVLPPFFYRPANDGQLLRYLKTVSDAAPTTPLIYYHFPNMTNVNFHLKEFITQARQVVPRLVGMKYTSVDMLELSRFCASEESKFFKIFTGYEQTLTPMLALGVRSAVCASFNFEEPVEAYARMKKNYPQNMDQVLCKQKELNDFADELGKGSFIHNVKRKLNNLTISDQLHLDVGCPRGPIVEGLS
ncbi:N-acetylneuraminate lyase-like [Brevipalpus obovatus]|uniref:N-acetylneuraminate lyase-like n=1 Tax=Brevipalpus obovatus TaxID=246614 RepID=UPI003D9E3352